ncbi:MAG: glycosyltransferase family 4 protein [Candidatus Paceibacterota bacterium]|jgi:glycosyltransferase involved in cell wall biosynthesis
MAIRLLIITQKVDRNDPILGFFHRWIEEFSKSCEKITVICLGEGEYSLPGNIKVLSLGKEGGVSGFVYLFRFYKYIFEERKNYDVVFVHMNQEYVLLGGLPWQFMGKKIMMWRNHPGGGFLTDMAVFLSNKVFCTSNQSYTARFKKTQIMPVGIDTSFFTDKKGERIKNSLLILGRIAPVKKQELIIDALKILREKGTSFTAHFIGDALPKDSDYYDMLQKKASEASMSESVSFKKSVSNMETPDIYNKFEIFINATPSGSLDKTIFEAMACGALPMTSNKSLIGVIDQRSIFEEDNANDLAEKIKELFILNDEEKNIYRIKNRDFVVDDHSLKSLVEKVVLYCEENDLQK